MNWYLTKHSVEQFISRFELTKSYKEASDELITLLNNSKKTDISKLGDPIFISDIRPEVRMVVKDKCVCVSVLPKDKFNIANDSLQNDLDSILENNELSKESFKAFKEQFKEEQRKPILEQMEPLEKEIAIIKEQKAALGLQLSKLNNQMDKFKQQLKLIEYGYSLETKQKIV